MFHEEPCSLKSMHGTTRGEDVAKNIYLLSNFEVRGVDIKKIFAVTSSLDGREAEGIH